MQLGVFLFGNVDMPDAGWGGICPSRESTLTHGVTHTTVRTPSARMREIIPWASGN